RPSPGDPPPDEDTTDAWWTRNQTQRSRANAQGWDPTPPARANPKPLAAYRLGFLSFALWIWHKRFCSLPQAKSTWGGVPTSVYQLRVARLVLSDEIHPNVFAALDRVLDDLDHMARSLVEAWQETGTFGGLRPGSPLVPGLEHWEKLRLLADRALAGD